MDMIPSTPSAGMIAPPEPRVPVTVRVATAGDLPFVDGLQKLHTKQVGWMPTQQLQGKIGAGHVLVAEGVAGCQLPVASEEGAMPSPLATGNSQLATPLGYVIGTDRYFKRDDVGIIYQVNVAPGRQRGLIGASLVRAMFERAAYGCRLFCCWCAQDIEANRFWESLGFVPLAFRAGSAKKSRIHIFWQRRIVAGDTTTPYWFPSQTGSGAIREDRLVLPIPPGTNWHDAKPIMLPAAPVNADEPKPLPTPRPKRAPKPRAVETMVITAGGLRLGPQAPAAPAPKPKPEPKPKPKVKNDPRHVAAARELRDRWLERANADPSALLSAGKYDVSRALTGAGVSLRGAEIDPVRALPAPLAA
jgi:hypothetical protein